MAPIQLHTGTGNRRMPCRADQCICGNSDHLFHPELVDPAGPLLGVSCTSVQVCLAVDFAGSIIGMSAFHSLSLGGGWPAFFDVSCASVTFCMALTGTAAVTFSPTRRGYTISILGLTAPPTGAPSRARPQGSVWPQAASPVEHIRELGSSRNGTGLDGQLRHVSQSHEQMGIQRFPKWYARPTRFAWPPMVTGASSTGMAASGLRPPTLGHMLPTTHSTLRVSRRGSAWR